MRLGEERAFTALYQRYWKRLLHFAVQKSGDFMDGEQVVQDVFVSLWKRRESLQIEKLENYLIVSVKYRILKLFARQRKNGCWKQGRP